LEALPHAAGSDGVVTIDAKGHNITLCDAMRQQGYTLSNCTVEESDFEKRADAELSGLLEFQFLNSSIITVTTPCLSQVCARARTCVCVRVQARVRVSSACARAHTRCSTV
jgi:hypothetical protein